MPRITPFLWFNNQAEEAMNFYTSVFPNSKIVSIRRYPEHATDEHLKGMEGKVLTGVFDLDGQQFMALDGGPVFKFTEAISFMISCKDQAEIDYYWEKLSAVPEAEQCGWLKDKFGISWQVVPEVLGDLMNGPNGDKVTEALMPMKKLDIAALEKAAQD